MSASNIRIANAKHKQVVKNTPRPAPPAKPQVANSTTSYFTDTIPESTLHAPESILPVDNINLCFVGGVSTGKSTILNAIFCEELTQCKIKRTTMVPTVYVENANDAPNLDNPEHIFSKIAQKNKEIEFKKNKMLLEYKIKNWRI